MEQVARQGDSPPLHIHRNEDELFHVVEGELSFRRGDEHHTVVAGEFFLVTRASDRPLTRGLDRSYGFSHNQAGCGGTEAGTEEGLEWDGRPCHRHRLYDSDPDPPLWQYLRSN
jgi:hypothetical protein